MFHPIAVEFMAEERARELARLAQSYSVQREARTGLREVFAAVLVKAGMLLDHRAAERAAAHVHPAI
jgi:hypothetical protein